MDSFGESLLSATNALRAKHGSQPLKWSAEAASKAEELVKEIASTGKLKHANHKGMGQNLAYSMGKEFTGKDAANMWYKEIENYNFKKPGFKPNTGHFTQLVWAETTEMGSAVVVKGKETYVVANYIPPGNVTNEGQFERNVKKAK